MGFVTDATPMKSAKCATAQWAGRLVGDGVVTPHSNIHGYLPFVVPSRRRTMHTGKRQRHTLADS